MTDERFWRIADKYERVINHATESEVIITDNDSAMKEIVYYDKGDLGKSVSDYSLLIKSAYGGKENYLKVVDQLKNLCNEYKELGHANFRKNYKKVFTN